MRLRATGLSLAGGEMPVGCSGTNDGELARRLGTTPASHRWKWRKALLRGHMIMPWALLPAPPVFGGLTGKWSASHRQGLRGEPGRT